MTDYARIAQLCQRAIPSKVLMSAPLGTGVIFGLEEALAAQSVRFNTFVLHPGERQLDALPYLEAGEIKHVQSEIVLSIASGTLTIISVDGGLPEYEIKKLSTLVDDTRCHVIVVHPAHVDPKHVLDEKALSNVIDWKVN